MLIKSLLVLISAIVINNYNKVNANNIINDNETNSDNSQYNKQYWDEFLPTIKCDARETLKDRFNKCSDWLLDLLNSQELLYKIRSINRYKYKIDNISDIIDIDALQDEIDIRKKLLDDVTNKNILNNVFYSKTYSNTINDNLPNKTCNNTFNILQNNKQNNSLNTINNNSLNTINNNSLNTINNNSLNTINNNICNGLQNNTTNNAWNILQSNITNNAWSELRSNTQNANAWSELRSNTQNANAWSELRSNTQNANAWSELRSNTQNANAWSELRSNTQNANAWSELRSNTRNANAWSELPLRIMGYNIDHQRQIGQHLNWYCQLLQNHWDMKFDKNYSDVKLNFYASYEYQKPKFYKESLNSEQTLAICLSAIEMDLLTSNNLTSNIELFANYLISRKDNVAKFEILRYRKYFNDKQNELLARHIISYYLSFSGLKKMNVAKYLTIYYVLNDLFSVMRPNQFLRNIRKYKTDNWFDIVIKQYLNNEFGTKYNKSYLESFQKIIMENKEYLKDELLPKFRKYAISVFSNLVAKHNKMLNDKNLINIKNNTIDAKIMKVLTGASANDGIHTIDSIINYLNLDKQYKLSKKCNNKG